MGDSTLLPPVGSIVGAVDDDEPIVPVRLSLAAIMRGDRAVGVNDVATRGVLDDTIVVVLFARERADIGGIAVS